MLATFASGQPRTEVVVGGVEVLFVLRGEDLGASAGAQSSFDTAAAGVPASTTLVLLVAEEQEARLAFARSFANIEVAIVPAEDGEVSGL